MSRRPGRVLVVDDDPWIVDLLATALQSAGCYTRGAADGAQALRILDDWRPDLIVLDLMMPGMDGRSFLDEQRHLDAIADIPVLLVSAVHDLPVQARGLRAVAVFEKPLDLDDFLTAVASLIGADQGRRAKFSEPGDRL